jgi:hypothetical protein
MAHRIVAGAKLEFYGVAARPWKIFAHSGNSSRIAAPAPRGRASRSGLGSPKMMAKKALYRYQSMAEVIPPA